MQHVSTICTWLSIHVHEYRYDCICIYIYIYIYHIKRFSDEAVCVELVHGADGWGGMARVHNAGPTNANHVMFLILYTLSVSSAVCIYLQDNTKAMTKPKHNAAIPQYTSGHHLLDS
jgi:hypothetical protein